MGFDSSAINYLLSSDHKGGDDLEYCRVRFKNVRFGRLLDVASGAGHFSSAFEADLKVICDPSINMLKVARSHFGLTDAVSCVAEKMPFADGSFDIVICRIALHHFKNPRLFFAESRRVMRNNALLVLVDSLVDLEDEYLNKLELMRDETHVKSYTLSEILSFASGFRLLEFHLFHKKHDFEEWAYRVSLDPERFNELNEAFLSLPDEIKRLLRVEVKNARVISYTDRKGLFIFERIDRGIK